MKSYLYFVFDGKNNLFELIDHSFKPGFYFLTTINLFNNFFINTK